MWSVLLYTNREWSIPYKVLCFLRSAVRGQYMDQAIILWLGPTAVTQSSITFWLIISSSHTSSHLLVAAFVLLGGQWTFTASSADWTGRLLLPLRSESWFTFKVDGLPSIRRTSNIYCILHKWVRLLMREKYWRCCNLRSLISSVKWLKALQKAFGSCLCAGEPSCSFLHFLWTMKINITSLASVWVITKMS